MARDHQQLLERMRDWTAQYGFDAYKLLSTVAFTGRAMPALLRKHLRPAGPASADAGRNRRPRPREFLEVVIRGLQT